MLNNLDIQPGAAVNRRIVGIKLFQFKLVHVPGCLHTGPDGLSHCAAASNDLINEDEDADDWLDRTISFAVILMNSQPSWSSRLNSSYRPTQATSYRPISHLLSHQNSCQLTQFTLRMKGMKRFPPPLFPILI